MAKGNIGLVFIGIIVLVGGAILTFVPSVSGSGGNSGGMTSGGATGDLLNKYPNKAQIIVKSDPSGVTPFVVGDKQYTAPFELIVDAGSYTIKAPASWTKDGVLYSYAKWDIGQVGIQRVVVIGKNSTTTLVAYYVKANDKGSLKLESIRGTDLETVVLGQEMTSTIDLRAPAYVNGESKGPTPVVLYVPVGVYTVSFGKVEGWVTPSGAKAAITEPGKTLIVRGVFTKADSPTYLLTVFVKILWGLGSVEETTAPASDVQVYLSDGQLGFTDADGKAIFKIEQGRTVTVNTNVMGKSYGSQTVTMNSDKAVTITYIPPQSISGTLGQSMFGGVAGDVVGILGMVGGFMLIILGLFAGGSRGTMVSRRSGS